MGGQKRERQSPLGADIHSTDSDRYDSEKRGLWYIYKLRQQGRYYLSACTCINYFECQVSDYPLRPPQCTWHLPETMMTNGFCVPGYQMEHYNSIKGDKSEQLYPKPEWYY